MTHANDTWPSLAAIQASSLGPEQSDLFAIIHPRGVQGARLSLNPHVSEVWTAILCKTLGPSSPLLSPGLCPSLVAQLCESTLLPRVGTETLQGRGRKAV